MLGPLEVSGPGGRVPITSRKERALLVALAGWGGELLTNDRLTDALWGEQPPRSNVKVLHNLVSGIRKVLGADAIETRPGGYLLRAASDEIDVRRFDRLASEGRRCAAEADWRAADVTAADGRVHFDVWRRAERQYKPFKIGARA